MPEGDTIFRAARTLHRALAGKRVVRFDTVLPALAHVDAHAPVAGRTVEAVSAAGKHLLMRFSGPLVLRTHMRMSGSWHVYRPGEPWQRRASDMRVLVAVADYVAVGFSVPVAEFLDARGLARHADLGALGPDLLAEGFDLAEALRRLRGAGTRAVGDALIDQRLVAGAGNVYKSEVLFVCRLDPFTPVTALTDDQVREVVGTARRLMNASVASGGRRHTTRRTDPAAGLWVYGRAGRPCRVCGTAISRRAQGPNARLTYWCPRCQPAARPVSAG